MNSTTQNHQEKVRNTVREGYKNIAQSQESSSCCAPSSCCGPDIADAATHLTQAIGYELSDLETLPEGANMGLSCGNPFALASLQPGEIVVDLGSGGGFDAFIAGRKVGEHGRVIGVDMTPEMLSKARNNILSYEEQTSLRNVEFRLGEIEHLPLADNSADVVISNCVINLSPDKPQVWREIFRILKPGGRVAVSDIALFQELPQSIRSKAEALIGCIAGALPIEDTKQIAEKIGFKEIQVETKSDYTEAMTHSKDPLFIEIQKALPENKTIHDYVTSMLFYAKKP